MTEQPGRRERKKAATRQKIADTALRLFLERGYDAVGIREVAAEADVAVTTLFSHFACKEALVFERDADFEERLTRAVTGRSPGEPFIPALREAVRELLRHCTSGEAAPIWQMICETPALREYEESMRLRHAASLAEALAVGSESSVTPTAARAFARFVIDAYCVARDEADPERAADEIFGMIQAAWAAAPSD
ncbi:TetR/AcrR family transcriptional regulator [Nocardia vermiculata]|uniref:TetR/AcrR family transcriptional regulator n=1 Tax=Nocardia vermiculata TaxID=257274 RepID=A0A846XSY6_9NOCA|nr:TetR/AcrR family transcriptional regulator [Nocardia vermiculata]NKY48990.1 TetR/AcrR family transcriptional regulator [Nocardia vermiculata]